MSAEIGKLLYVFAACGIWGLPTFAAEPESMSVIALAQFITPKYPKDCLGIEVVPYLNQSICGSESITEAKLNWESLAKVAEQQTDYVVEVRGPNVLIRPKSAPSVHDAPVVERLMTLHSMPNDWHSIAKALRGMSFENKSEKFDASINECSKTYAADRPLQLSSELVSNNRDLFKKIASAEAVKLSDLLFLVAQMASANCWCYESSENIIINGELKVPRKLTEGSVSFTGPFR